MILLIILSRSRITWILLPRTTHETIALILARSRGGSNSSSCSNRGSYNNITIILYTLAGILTRIIIS
jgi:hypothetical protein